MSKSKRTTNAPPPAATANTEAVNLPSSTTLLKLTQLGEVNAENIAQDHPDFFAVKDYALEQGWVEPCAVADPHREPNLVWTNPLDGTEMVWIPPGWCQLGPDRERVQLPGFSLARFPITNAQFSAFTKTYLFPHKSIETSEVTDDYANGEFVAHWSKGKPPAKLLQHPVVYVSYWDALAYCAWAGLSVPGEYQWEKAARGRDGRVFPWGNDFYSATMQAKPSNAPKAFTPEMLRTPYGCEHFVGNVATWCQMGDPAAKARAPVANPPIGTVSEPLFVAVRGAAFKQSNRHVLKGEHRRRLAAIRRNDWVGIRPACLLDVRPAKSARM
jgi:formylglycine-generating enzyme required for sulfatase activity